MSVLDSENNSNLDQVKGKAELLRQSLLKFDKDLDDQIDLEELLACLDSNMTNGKKFDRNLAKKIFSVLDLDDNGKITCDEFIKSFMQIEEEIKSHLNEMNAKYLFEKENNARLFKMMMESKNEKINEEGLGPNAKITIEITNIEFISTMRSFQGISIRIKFGKEVKETRILNNLASLTWKERFEFNVSRRDNLIFEVVNTDSSGRQAIIGTVRFPLDTITNQEEYDVLLEIPDEDDEKIINAKINSKINFIWSTYKHHQDQHTKSEKALNQYKNLLEKSNQLLENLNEPLKFASAVEHQSQRKVENPFSDHDSQNMSHVQQQSTIKVKTQSTGIDKTKQYEYADKVEDFIKNTLSKI